MKSFLEYIYGWTKKNSYFSIIIVTGLVGALFVFITLAATPKASLEPETANLSNAFVNNDANASNGSYLQFAGASVGGDSGGSGGENENPPPIDEPAPDQSANSITRHGITWVFDKSYPVGQFANGDWWVKGPVTITRITPDFTGSRHGWMVNPSDDRDQNYDPRINSNFNSSRVPSLPYVANGGESIVKAISQESRSGPYCITEASGHTCYLKTAAVLSVLDSVPENNGSTVFRPPYFGPEKPLYSTTNLQTGLLPSLAPVANTPSMASMERRFERLQLDHVSNWRSRYLHPGENLPMYGANVVIGINEAALRLMLNDPLEDKRQLLYDYVNAGIDYFAIAKHGGGFPADGGHMHGRKLPVVFAAVMLDDTEMKNAISSASIGPFQEDRMTFYGKNGVALWGKHPVSESAYWQAVTGGGGGKDKADPYGYIDGGYRGPGTTYQDCCTSQGFKGEALAAELLPEAKQVWNYNAFFDYAERWVNFGAWASPDPCKLEDPGSYDGTCVPGNGRFSSAHGSKRDGGGYSSDFVDSMWDAYKP